jgi:fatty acid desaturase
MTTARNEYGPVDSELADRTGLRFREFRKTLRPRYGVVWAQIGLGHAALWLSLALAAQAETVAAQLVAAVLGAIAVGYALAYVQLFFHEAAHFLLAPSRRLNDVLANTFVGVLIGQDIKQYRPIHFAHHRDLGTGDDTERTYFEALTPRFVMESLTGIRVLKVLALRRRALDSAAPAKSEKVSRNRVPLVAGLLLHASIVIGMIATGRYGATLAWVAGIGTVYPFLAAIRQLLEHRPLAGAGGPVPYAATHRMFGGGVIASTFGGAGFNRHLLHHMEPQISCTRLVDLEGYLKDTERAVWLDEHRTTYREAVAALLVRQAPHCEPTDAIST